MNKAAPWSIKGVDFDAREAAREAAEREGMTLGEWLNDIISDRAAEIGASTDDFNDDDRLNAVSARLARLRDGGDRAKRRGDRRPAHDVDENENENEDQDDGRPRPRRAKSVSRPARDREVSWRESDAADALLEDAIRAFESRASRSQEKTARALAEVAELIQSSNSRSEREGQTLKSISRRLAEIENRVARGGDDQAYRPIRGALSRLEDRLETLTKRSEAAPDPSGLRDIDAKLSEIAEQLDRKPPERVPAVEDDRLARIESKIASLAVQMEKSAQAQAQRAQAQDVTAAPVATAPVVSTAAPARSVQQSMRRPLVDLAAQIAQRQRELDSDAAGPFPARRSEARPPFDMRREPGELETRLTAIVERLEKRIPDVEAARAPQVMMLSGLQGDIARMSAHLEKMREAVASRPVQTTSDASLDQLRTEIAAVAHGLVDLAPRASVAAIESGVRQLGDRLESLRLDGRREASLAPIEQIADELRAGMRELDPRPAIESLEGDMRAIAAKIESLEARGGVDPQTIRAIYDQTREVRDLLSRAAIASAPGERAQRELADLAQRLEGASQAGVSQVDVARIVEGIRAVVAEGAGGEGIRALESRIERLSERIDTALAAGSGGQQFAAFGDRLDKLHRAVAQSLATPRPQPAAETGHLEELVRDLAARVDRAADPRAGADELIALQRQIENISQKIERSNGQDETVASLERMIADLFGQLESTRGAAFAAAEGAARAAVREALADVSSSDKQELSREIADLRSVQNSSDQRTHATLKAVHETLERVVDRLTSLEDDIIERPSTLPHESGRDERGAQLAGAGASMTATAALARAKAPAVNPPPTKAGRPAPASAVDADILIEPGAGRSQRQSSQASDLAEKSAQAGFIAAARRAALAAQAASAGSAEGAPLETLHAKGGSALTQAKMAFERRRKPILLSLAALVVLLGGLQIARFYSDAIQLPAVVRPAPPVAPAADAARPQTQPTDAANTAPAAGAATDAASAAKPPAGPAAQPLQTKRPSAALEQPLSSAPPAAARADAGNVDPSPVGAIQRSADAGATLAALETLSGHGDPAAQYELGSRQADGNQTPRDLKSAAQWFEKSATKGFAPSQYRLGVLYERGLGVPRDTALAKLWYQRSADRGNVRAMHNLAVLVADGGGKPDYAGAAKWFRKAAEFGIRDSQYNLAILYARGMGGPQDLAQSYAWFSAAAAQGDEDAGKKRDEIGGRLDPATLARAKAMAAAFQPRAIDPAVNEVSPPPGGWQAAQPPNNTEKTPARPKVSRL